MSAISTVPPEGHPVVSSGSGLKKLKNANLPNDKPLRKMLGASIFVLAVGLGSGEFVIFPLPDDPVRICTDVGSLDRHFLPIRNQYGN